MKERDLHIDRRILIGSGVSVAVLSALLLALGGKTGPCTGKIERNPENQKGVLVCPEGNDHHVFWEGGDKRVHGEYLFSTPTHVYFKALYNDTCIIWGVNIKTGKNDN